MKVNNITAAFEADELLALARVDMEKGLLDGALAKLKQALSLDNHPVETKAVAGRVYAQLRLWDRAKPLMAAYLEENPQAINEQFQLGMLNFDSGDMDSACDIWSRLLESQPTHPPALFYTGLLKAQQKDVENARNHLERLIQTAPADNLYFERGKDLLQRLNQSPKTSGDLATDDVALKKVPESPYQTEH